MNSSGQGQPVRLMDTFRNLFYTPLYVAVGGGFLYREGLDISLSTVPAGRSSVDLLKDGSADIMQTGLSRSFMDLDQGNEDAPLHIAETNQRDGFFLLSREPADGWTWKDLERATVIPVGFTPVPWTTLRRALTLRGVDIDRVLLVRGLSAQEAIDRFRNREADYIHMPNPQAQQLVEDGDGYLVAAVGPELGYLSFSSFAATPAYVADNPEVVRRFVKGFHNALKWLAAGDVAELLATVAPFFPETAEVVLERGIRRYRKQQTWPEDPLIGEDGFMAMRDVLIEGGAVKGRYAYERVVRPEFALESMGG
jgi:NitT/TauT family transport system substrate-binding protein